MEKFFHSFPSSEMNSKRKETEDSSLEPNEIPLDRPDLTQIDWSSKRLKPSNVPSTALRTSSFEFDSKKDYTKSPLFRSMPMDFSSPPPTLSPIPSLFSDNNNNQDSQFVPLSTNSLYSLPPFKPPPKSFTQLSSDNVNYIGQSYGNSPVLRSAPLVIDGDPPGPTPPPIFRSAPQPRTTGSVQSGPIRRSLEFSPISLDKSAPSLSPSPVSSPAFEIPLTTTLSPQPVTMARSNSDGNVLVNKRFSWQQPVSQQPINLVKSEPSKLVKSEPLRTFSLLDSSDSSVIEIEDDDEDLDKEEHYGDIRCNCVDIHQFSGKVSNGEMVFIVREHDPDVPQGTLKVFNAFNIQVGVIEKTVSQMIAYLMEKNDILKVEGTIPHGAENKYAIPCVLHLIGKREHKERVIQTLRSKGYHVSLYKASVLNQNAPIVVDDIPSTFLSTPMPPHVTILGRVTKDTVEEQLDDIFRTLSQQEEEGLPETNEPVGLQTRLYGYQKRALTWMLRKEDHNAESVFWKKSIEGSSFVYRNLITNTVSYTKPKHSCGGILADDMGLGKTLTTIALLLSHKKQNEQCEKTTLIICPLSLLGSWRDQVDMHTSKNHLSVYIYHGASRNTNAAFLAQHDIVITTYNIIAAELKQKSVLFKIDWWRIVCDEAHNIKSRKTLQSKAAFELKAENKWCITGTPIQNSLNDLYSLIKFLGIEPLNDYNWWTRVIIRPMKNGDKSGLLRLQTLLKSICIRRTKGQKINGIPICELPPKHVSEVFLELSKSERDQYDRLYNKAQNIFTNYVNNGTVLSNYAHILEILLRLRQACNHPALCKDVIETGLPTNVKDQESIKRLLELLKNSSEECSLCMDTITDVITPCSHMYCRNCIDMHLKNKTDCPLCRGPLTSQDLIFSTEVSEEISTTPVVNNQESSKVNALIKELLDHKGEKALVYSQWTSMLDLIEPKLKEYGFKWARLDGKSNASKREASIEQFRKDPSVTVFLISLKAGGVGLTLIEANHVYIMDPWWNVSAEEQAIDRAHRLGQKKPVSVTRFVCKNTIEEPIIELQQKKLLMSQSAFGLKSKNDIQDIRLQDLKLLFSFKKEPPTQPPIITL